MLIESLVELHTWLHSCLYFSPLEKLFLKSLLDTSSIASYLSSFLSFFLSQSCQHLDTSGSIEQVPTSSIAFWHLVDWSSFCSWSGIFVPRYLLDTCICRRAFSWHLPQRMAWHLLTPNLSRFTEDLFKLPRVIRSSFLSISLSIVLCFLSQTLSSHSNLVSQGFFQKFSRFSSLSKLLISHSSCISCFET